jgi:DNA-binding NtrC family response regulator
LTELATPDDEQRAGTLRHEGEEPVRALIVDDEDLSSTLACVLRQRGIIAETAENGFTALDMLERSYSSAAETGVERTAFDVVLVDVRMPGMTGPQFLQRVKAAGYPIVVLMMTALADIATTVSAVKAGAHGFLTKPFASNESVVIEVLNAAQLRRLRERTEHLQRALSSRPPGSEQHADEASAGPRPSHPHEHLGAPISAPLPSSNPVPSSNAMPSLDATALAGAVAPKTMDELVVALGLGTMGYPDAKKRVLAEFNDAYVGALLRATAGNMSEAARRSGLDRSNFRRLVRTTSVDVAAASSRTSADDDG